MSHVVHLEFKDKPSVQLQPTIVSTAQAKVWLKHYIAIGQSPFFFHLTHEESLTTFDVSGEQNYLLLFFQHEGSCIRFKEAIIYYKATQDPLVLETSYKLVLVLPSTALPSIEGLQSLYIRYCNDTLLWPTAIADKFVFKIPEVNKHSFAYKALAPLNIQFVSQDEFYRPTQELPLFIKVPQQTIPNDAFLYELAKKQKIRFGVICKSYLSGYLFGIHIYEMSPSNLIPNLIYQENEIYI